MHIVNAHPPEHSQIMSMLAHVLRLLYILCVAHELGTALGDNAPEVCVHCLGIVFSLVRIHLLTAHSHVMHIMMRTCVS